MTNLLVVTACLLCRHKDCIDIFYLHLSRRVSVYSVTGCHSQYFSWLGVGTSCRLLEIDLVDQDP